MLNICSSVQDHNQSTIHKGFWMNKSKEQKELYWSLERLKICVWRNESEDMRLKKRVWRNESEERAPEDMSSEASHQKPLHQSWQSTLYEVYNH